MEQARNENPTFENQNKDDSTKNQTDPDIVLFPLYDNDDNNVLNENDGDSNSKQLKTTKNKKNKQTGKKIPKNGNKNSNKFLDLLHFIILYSFAMFMFYLFFSFIASLFGKQYWPFN